MNPAPAHSAPAVSIPAALALEAVSPPSCPKCGQDLNSPIPEKGACSHCRQIVYLWTFARLVRRPAPEPSPSGADGAICYFHDARAALAACQSCGRYVCELCELKLEGRQICPDCFNRGLLNQQWSSLRQHEILYDTLALELAFAGWFLWMLAPLLDAYIVYLLLRHWNGPRACLLPRNRWRFYLAMPVMAVPLGYWLFLFVLLKR